MFWTDILAPVNGCEKLCVGGQLFFLDCWSHSWSWETPTWPVEELVTWTLSQAGHLTPVFFKLWGILPLPKSSTPVLSCQSGLPRKHTLRNQEILLLHLLPGCFAFISSTFCWAVCPLCPSTKALTVSPTLIFVHASVVILISVWPGLSHSGRGHRWHLYSGTHVVSSAQPY